MSENQFFGPEAVLDITNNSSKASNYLISVTFESPDGRRQLDTASAYVSNLSSGQTTTETATSWKDELKGTEVHCRISNVERYAS